MNKTKATLVLNKLNNYKKEVKEESVTYLIEETQEIIRDLMKELEEKEHTINELLKDSGCIQNIDGGNISI